MNYMIEAINESKKAFYKKEVPVGAIVVFNNKIIAKSHNSRILNNDVTCHAEINAIRLASSIIGDWRLNDCDLYVTLKPCSMCMEVIKQSRIRNVYYLLDKLDNKKEYNKTIVRVFENEDLLKKYKEDLSEFFTLNTNR